MTAFKAYDIRGLSPGEIDSAFAERLGSAIASKFLPARVMIGRDMRLTSPELEMALINGFVSRGVDVVKIGLCSTPMFNVLLGLNAECATPFDLGVMVTASHNPGQYNGFKMTRGNCLPVGHGSGMEELEEAFAESKVVPPAERDPAKGGKSRKSKVVAHGNVTDDPSALDRYVTHILSLAKLPREMPKMKIAIDAGNGMAGAVLPELLKRLPWLEVVPLYFELDGSFPNHEANPLKRATLVDLQHVVREHGCAMGVAFDGDADRVGFVDEIGEAIPGDLLTAFFAQEILRDRPDGLVLYDVRSSWAVPEAVTEAGGHSDMCPVGHAKIKRLMREKSASFGGELSMHFYFSDLWNCESGDFAMLVMLRRLVREGKTLAELWKPLARFAKSEEINFEVEDPVATIEALERRYAPESSKIIRMDGVRIEFGDWWFSIRTSNTEPLVRLNVEAKSKEMLTTHVEELRHHIHSV